MYHERVQADTVPTDEPGPDRPDERKERVLHTRVPESLERQLKQRARRLGMSVSTVVRHVLLNTFGLVEDIVTDSTNVALAVTGQEPIGGPEAARPDVVAWQDAVLNVNAVCERCNAVLRAGTRAAIGVRDRPGPRAILCRRCLDRIAEAPAPPGRSRRRR
ncbi:MAG TPA: hypothetical protein VKA21_10250 [Candidatus Binatia bacterium]|nr:hypothetical protein [Candidatus Binatia bacterium]